ncbi:MAG: acetylhydrolase, partial [Gammaproteobacteria bacterium]|nr:acetylhydrolase [Gammaproteobacteria bacterium]
MKKIIMPIIVLIFTASLHCADAAEQLYTTQPPATPELAKSGHWKVGVSTLETNNPQQLSTKDFTTREDRPLTLEVWYPAENGTTSVPATYTDLTRSKQRFELQGVAWRDAEPLKGETKFPLVVLSHGYTGSRSTMFYLAEHLASHGYVVVGIDHTDSTNAEVDFFKAPYSGFTSTLFHRARDQQFVLDYFSTHETPFANLVDSDNAAVIGYSMGGYGALNTAGGCYQYTEASLL